MAKNKLNISPCNMQKSETYKTHATQARLQVFTDCMPNVMRVIRTMRRKIRVK